MAELDDRLHQLESRVAELSEAEQSRVADRALKLELSLRSLWVGGAVSLLLVASEWGATSIWRTPSTVTEEVDPRIKNFRPLDPSVPFGFEPVRHSTGPGDHMLW